jgi:hypothetical protein
MREGPLDMVFHGVLLAVVLYVFMKYVLGQSRARSLARAILVGSLSVSYMVLFGHRLPGRVNHNVM